jgi:glycosyltransferase involved in cell wall biosynthesis
MESQRKKIGILYHFSPKWMGGVIYILNVVKVLSFLKDEDMPEIFLFYNPNLQRFVDELDYPYLHKIVRPYPSVYKNFIKSFLTQKNTFVEGLIKEYQLNTIFPLHDYPVKTRLNCKLISWYADLQQEHYPQFFSYFKRLERSLRIKFILKNTKDLMVSSYDVKSDFYRFFKIPNHVKFHVYHFVSIVDKFPTYTKEEIQKQYDLPSSYFLISNQFHKHKNHKVVFQALSHLMAQGKIVNLVLTGKLPEDSKSEYINELKAILKQNELEKQVTFLGVLPRDMQLSIMRHADAIVQPSLFEGWSTVIEDAISLQKPVICSNLSVNVEQLKEKGTYFSSHNYKELSEILVSKDFSAIPTPIYESYENRVKNAAETLYKILTE